MPPADTLNGHTILRVEEIQWQHDDDVILRQSTVMGRALVETNGGGRFWGLVCLPFVPFGEVGRCVVAVLEPSTGRFAAIPMPRAKVPRAKVVKP
jgi:hypothetical protein